MMYHGGEIIKNGSMSSVGTVGEKQNKPSLGK